MYSACEQGRGSVISQVIKIIDKIQALRKQRVGDTET